MFLNVLLGFVIPWVFGIILYFIDKKTLLIIAPLSAVVAYVVNEFGSHLNFWRLLPLDVSGDISAMSTNLGLYPILASYLIFFVQRTKKSPYILVIIFALITTVLEYLGVIFHAVQYGNGWNVWWTFISYLLPYLLVLLYYNKLKGIQVFT